MKPEARSAVSLRAAVPEVLRWGAAEAARRVRAGDVSSAELVRAHIDRIEAVNPAINAVVVRCFEEALSEARTADLARAAGRATGPLHGVPVSIKEQYLVRGTPSTWGLRHRTSHRAEQEGTLVRRLREAGAIPLVKTNVPQLLLLYETDNDVYGRTNNPWDLGRSPAGSSGGEAALIAAFGSPLGLGSDVGGSIRVPSHCAGIHGLKPTAYRLPHDDNPRDIAPPSEAIVSQGGPMARHVEDLSLAMRIFVGDTPAAGPVLPPVPWREPDRGELRGLRIAVQEDDGNFRPSPAIRRAVREAAAALASLGAEVIPWEDPSGTEVMRHFLSIVCADGFRSRSSALRGERMHRLVAPLFLSGHVPKPVRRVVAAALGAAGQERLAQIVSLGGLVAADELLRRLGDRFAFREHFALKLREARVDAILCPPYGLPALQHGASKSVAHAASYAYTYNLLGLPAGVVAATRVRPGEESDRRDSKDLVERAARAVERGSAGLPVGVQVSAPWWREDTVLRVMAALEAHFRAQPDYPDLSCHGR